MDLKGAIEELEAEVTMLKYDKDLKEAIEIVLQTLKNRDNEIHKLKQANSEKAFKINEQYIPKKKIEDSLKVCQEVYEREMKPYKTEYGLDVTNLSKKEKEKLVNTRNCLITQMETYKQLLGVNE